MKKLIILGVIVLSQFIVYSQSSIDKLNGYKYINIPVLKYKDGSFDKYGVANQVKEIFKSKGFLIVTESELKINPPQELKENPYLLLLCTISHDDFIYHEVSVSLFNINQELIFSGSGEAKEGSDKSKARKSTRRALNDISYNLRYNYDSNLTPKLILPDVETTEETEESLMNYYGENELNPIEGIYKSYQSETMGYYKIGIKKFDNIYKAIILESEHNHWKLGEVKAIFEPTSMKSFYSTKWFMGNKTQEQTFAMMENSAILSIEFKNPETNEKYDSKFIKMYPPAEGNISFNKVQKSSGSGFFLTTNGIIATNAHVVENAEAIKIQISNEVGNFEYSAKVLLLDNKNDVALLKIEDEKFSGMSEIPYSIIEKAEIGEKAFTIGYPLNDVMGTNYKVTDGIVSSVSGIDDDMRYYQISVPLQPGNSGGPLFNSSGDIIGITSARLNSKAVGTDIENVNYAIKISYLLNLYNMLPNSENLKTTPTETSKELQDQVKILKNYVCLIIVN